MSSHIYGCHNRAPFVPAYKATGGSEWIPTFGQPECQYTRFQLTPESPANRDDPGCVGCKHRMSDKII